MYFDRISDGLVVDLGIAAHTLTRALDYVGINDHSHGRRVGLICHRIARHMGWDKNDQYFILLAGMLHDCGVSSSELHKSLMEDINHPNVEEHCQRGFKFLKSFPPFRKYAPVIKYHHQKWDHFYNGNIIGLKIQANLIYLADRLDVAFINHCQNKSSYEIIQNKNVILDELRPYVGEFFCPELFDALDAVAGRESFWFELKEDFLDEALFETINDIDDMMSLNFNEVEALGELISRIIDTKSPFTHYHSIRVADLVYSLGGLMRLNEFTRKTLRVSGLLHDVGKLRAPERILEKPGKLDDDEFARIKRHTMDSKSVLNALFPNSDIARWAAHHHEKIDGSGYPFGLKGDQLDLPTRILTICDIFQALCQKRSYREALDLDQVLGIMNSMEAEGKLDTEVMAVLKKNARSLFEIANFEGTHIEDKIARDLSSGLHAKAV